MINRFKNIFVIVLLAIAVPQLSTAQDGKLYPEEVKFSLAHKFVVNDYSSLNTIRLNPLLIDDPIRNSILLPLQMANRKMPVFCKMEHEILQNAIVPVKFRLGSLDYVNRLEGKYNFD